MGIVGKIRRYRKEYGLKFTIDMVNYRRRIKYHLGKQYFPLEISRDERQEQKRWIPEQKIKISIVVPVYNTPEAFLCEMIESVQNQTYSDWELCLADASDSRQEEIEEIVREYMQEDERIKYRRLPENDGISNNTNHGIVMATGDYIGLLDHDDILHPSALYYVMQEIIYHQADYIYTDELSFDKKTERVQSIHFKPDFSQESLRCNNYICHFSVFERSLLQRAGMFRKSFDGSQDYDMFLRLTDEADNIRHVPRVLYYWRCHAGSVASQVGAKPYTVEAGRRAIEEHLRRQQIPAKVNASKEHGSFYQVTYAVPQDSSVFLLCETARTAEWVKAQLTGVPWQILAVDVETDRNVLKKNLKIWSKSDVMVLIREGYRPKQEKGQWLQELLQCLQPKENMVAAPIVYEPDGCVYHAGYCYDKVFPEKIRPLYRGFPGQASSYMNRLSFRQNVSLLGGAVLAVKPLVFRSFLEKCRKNTALFQMEKDLFSDTIWFSLCLTAKEKFGDCVITPYASFERRRENREEYPEGIAVQQERWQVFFGIWEHLLEKPDPHSNPGMRVFGKYYFLWQDRKSSQ
ncbi:MAG: glycosyltransferase [Lachnospiraceae bacterium]|nr:glycosyltransferase [Lachnospiraceae bacterium]